jgi:hypothetical protein
LTGRAATDEVRALDAFGGWKFSHVSELRHVWPVSFSDCIWEILYFYAPNRFESAGLFKAEFEPADSGEE